MNRDISPPATKRRKISTPPVSASSEGMRPTPNPAVLPPLAANALRVFSWNINGISPFLQPPITSFFSAMKENKRKDAKGQVPSASLRAFLHRHQWPSMLFLQEVKIASKDTVTQDAVRTAVNSRLPLESVSDGAKGPLYNVHFTLPTDPHNARGPRGSGKVYGVCSILRHDLHDAYEIAVRTVHWDLEGRISVVEIKCRSTPAKLAVFNIYAVNGTDNLYRDTRTGAVRGTRHDRKREFHRLLMKECKKLEGQGWDVLLAGDMNVAPDERDGYPKLRVFPQEHVVNRADFHANLLEDSGQEKKRAGLNGVDIWRKMHGEERRYTYYPRNRECGTSCDRVDCFIAGRKLWEKGCVIACGIMNSEEERGPSDHVPIWADVDLKPDPE
ncbi:hypothetical protein yc1106_03609 [Curvularia clavata]|uniref:Endonuclease/exonuclease/phosphatase domain-containing protein n=1 Tax=Curvularia clavata TaxID=95742 RepID=A0A9Q8Z622_CURCL|nr:hypothetical protein yc1106_03609 [Curvularia clavata]